MHTFMFGKAPMKRFTTSIAILLIAALMIFINAHASQKIIRTVTGMNDNLNHGEHISCKLQQQRLVFANAG